MFFEMTRGLDEGAVEYKDLVAALARHYQDQALEYKLLRKQVQDGEFAIAFNGLVDPEKLQRNREFLEGFEHDMEEIAKKTVAMWLHVIRCEKQGIPVTAQECALR